MIFSRARVIFLHLPKTAGNSLQTVLEPFSDDRRVAVRHQDGRDRFEVVGPLTPAKHSTLSDYAQRLGRDIDDYRIAIGCRDPFDRALAMYFSPHGWMKQDADGQWSTERPYWNRNRFLRRLSEMQTAEDFLRLGGKIRAPDWIIRYENLAKDFADFVRDAGLKGVPALLPHVNASRADDEQRARARDDGPARDAVTQKLAWEYETFGYSLDASTALRSGGDRPAS
jgi:hypothetical protein